MSVSDKRKIWLLRHAQSKAQTEEEYGIDTGLSNLGIQQSKRLRSVFKDIIFDRIYLSPLKRARETFEFSGIKGKTVEFDSRLVEELPENGYAPLLPYADLPVYAKADRQESWGIGVMERAAHFMDDLYRQDSPRTLILSHCGFFSSLLAVFLSSQHHGSTHFNKFKYCMMNNTGISVLYLGPERKNDALLCWNDIRHVHDLIDPDPLRPVPDPRRTKKSIIENPLKMFRRKR